MPSGDQPASDLPVAVTRELAEPTAWQSGQEESARFLAFGDSGTGTPAQMAVAQTMLTTCNKVRCGFAVHLGDIFYVRGPRDTADPRYMDWWERPYAPLGLPFYMTLGNHDYYGDPDASVAWTARSPSKRWLLPARYYTFRHGGVRFLALDTNEPTPAQATFFRGVLERSRLAGERWVVAMGHHPRKSVGQHGDADSDYAAWWDALLCGRADLFLAGHDHDKQVLQAHCGVTLAVSGAAAMLRDVGGGPGVLFSRSTLGFAIVDIAGPAATLRMYDDAGGTEFEHRLARRNQSPCLAEVRCDGRCDSDPTCRPAK
jgi:hypothetical protein